MHYIVSFQTMAIATLALCYNNPAVFTSVVKIRKGQAVQLIMNSGNMDSFKRIMACFTAQVNWGCFTPQAHGKQKQYNS